MSFTGYKIKCIKKYILQAYNTGTRDKNQETIKTVKFRLYFKTAFTQNEDGFEIKPWYYIFNRFLFFCLKY